MRSSIFKGILGFGIVSTIVFATVAWAERWLFDSLGVGGTYAFWSLLFVAGSALALQPLVSEPRRRLRFAIAVAGAFLAYAVAWIACYFAIGGQKGEWTGVIAGAVLMGFVLCASARAWTAVLPVIAVLLLGNIAGYFGGRMLWTSIAPPLGMLSWGIVYGILVGGALGFSIYRCQSGAKRSDSAARP